MSATSSTSASRAQDSVTVYDASTGMPHSICFHSGDARSFAAAVSEATGLPRENLVIAGPPWVVVEPRRLHRISQARFIFVFPKSLWQQKATEQCVVPLEPQDISVPNNASETTLECGTRAPQSSPLMNALLQYERGFFFELAQGKALFAGARSRAKACTDCISQCRMVELALRSALSNLERHFRHCAKRYEKFRSSFLPAQEAAGEVLREFERGLDLLRHVPLHQSLISQLDSSGGSSSSGVPLISARRTLADCVSIEKLQVWYAQACSHEQSLDSEGKRLGRKFERVETAVNELLKQHALVGLENGSTKGSDGVVGSSESAKKRGLLGDGLGGRSVDEAEKTVAAEVTCQAAILNELERDAKGVRARVDLALAATSEEKHDEIDLSLSALSAAGSGSVAAESPSHRRQVTSANSSAALEACAALDKLQQHHMRVCLPRMRESDVRLRDTMREYAEAKAAVQVAMANALRRLSKAQAQMSELTKMLAVILEGLSVQQDIVGQLMTVVRMPSAYAACVAEVARRRAFGRIYKEELERFQECIAKMREDEVTRRENFLITHGKHVPLGIVPGLAGGGHIPHCELLTNRFDTNLPVVDAAEVREVYQQLRHALRERGIDSGCLRSSGGGGGLSGGSSVSGVCPDSDTTGSRSAASGSRTSTPPTSSTLNPLTANDLDVAGTLILEPRKVPASSDVSGEIALLRQQHKQQLTLQAASYEAKLEALEQRLAAQNKAQK